MSIYDERIKLLESGKENPTKEELQKAYGYLDYCLKCGGKIGFFDRILFNSEHSMFGNSHRWKCRNANQDAKSRQEVMRKR